YLMDDESISTARRFDLGAHKDGSALFGRELRLAGEGITPHAARGGRRLRTPRLLPAMGAFEAPKRGLVGLPALSDRARRNTLCLFHGSFAQAASGQRGRPGRGSAPRACHRAWAR